MFVGPSQNLKNSYHLGQETRHTEHPHQSQSEVNKFEQTSFLGKKSNNKNERRIARTMRTIGANKRTIEKWNMLLFKNSGGLLCLLAL